MKTKLLGLIACVLLGTTAAVSASPYVVTLEEVGSNVVATGMGNLDVTVSRSTDVLNSGINPVIGGISIGPGDFTSALFAIIPGATGPGSFGSGAGGSASSGTGDQVALFANSGTFDLLLVPAGYTSDSPLADSMTFDGATFASLGVTPGTYVWTWGRAADQSFTLEIGQTPLPAALPLFATGLGGLGLLGWRRKRKNIAAIAA